MKEPNGLYTGTPEPEKVEAFMRSLDHPLSDVVAQLRKIMLAFDKKVGEGIYWNAPTFYFTGRMGHFEPKEYKRYIAGLNLFKKDEVRVILLRGARVKDPTGLLEGDYADGRRLFSITSLADLKGKESALKSIVLQLVQQMK